MKTPYKVLYSNDTTNISTCSSPYSPQRTWRYVSGTGAEAGEWVYRSPTFTAEMLEASVDETVGVGIDVHLLQPGVGWVPWWKSQVYPFEKHIQFMKQQTGKEPWENGFATYMAKGGDMVDVFVRRCRAKHLAPFVSFRLNDSHGHEFVEMDPSDIPSWAWHVFSPIHVKHPEWRLGSDIRDWNSRVLNWAIPEVRAAKLAFIEEIIAQYDIDGFELDFMRHCNFFNQDETTAEERSAIMVGFVRQVRAALDRATVHGEHRWLCVRIPAQIACHASVGIDVHAFAGVGVDMFNLSNYYYTEQSADIREVRQAVGEGASIYLEMCHCTHQREPAVMPPANRRYDYRMQRRTTPVQYATTAHLAHTRGADGVSTFNFAYYREHGVGERGPGAEPPFWIHERLGDAQWLAQQPQHYFIAEGWGKMGLVPRQMPCALGPGETADFTLDMAPTSEQRARAGRLRIQASVDLGTSQWGASLNGVPLVEINNRAEPFDARYPQLLGGSAQHRAWTVPPHVVKDGINQIRIERVGGSAPITLTFLDLAIDTGAQA